MKICWSVQPFYVSLSGPARSEVVPSIWWWVESACHRHSTNCRQTSGLPKPGNDNSWVIEHRSTDMLFCDSHYVEITGTEIRLALLYCYERSSIIYKSRPNPNCVSSPRFRWWKIATIRVASVFTGQCPMDILIVSRAFGIFFLW